MRRGTWTTGLVRLAIGLACGLSMTACDPDDGRAPSEGDGSPGGKADDVDEDAEGGPVEIVAVTASSVEALERDLSSVQPEVGDFAVGDPLDPEDYLRPMSALGHYGPLGELGPLGVLGPVGDATFNPSTWIDLAGPWSALAAELAEVNGPLSADGPLGANGPLDRERWRADLEALGGIGSSFVDQLEGGGLLVPLGPAGPLGALGPLGPLGPVGAHGYEADDDGQWLPEDGECVHSDERDVCRHVVVPWNDEESRTYELFEHYEAEFAASMTDNDTSFMVTGELSEGASESFAFTSAQTQLVTVHVMGQWTLYDPATSLGLLATAATIGYRMPTLVPNYIFPFNFYDHGSRFDDFDVTLEITTEEGTVSVTSDSIDMVDWISVVVPAGARLTAHVSLASRWRARWRVFGPEYRLFVVGSTPARADVPVTGDHRARLTP